MSKIQEKWLTAFRLFFLFFIGKELCLLFFGGDEDFSYEMWSFWFLCAAIFYYGAYHQKMTRIVFGIMIYLSLGILSTGCFFSFDNQSVFSVVEMFFSLTLYLWFWMSCWDYRKGLLFYTKFIESPSFFGKFCSHHNTRKETILEWGFTMGFVGFFVLFPVFVFAMTEMGMAVAILWGDDLARLFGEKVLIQYGFELGILLLVPLFWILFMVLFVCGIGIGYLVDMLTKDGKKNCCSWLLS